MFRGLITCGCAAVLAALVLVPAALAGGPSMLVGAAEDAPKSTDAATSKVKLDLAKLSGYDTIRVTQQWTNGATSPGSNELGALQNAANAAALNGIRLVVAIYDAGSSSTPASPTAQAQFAQYAAATARALPSVTDFVVGNEPNNNYYWQPQFNADGSDAAAQGYESLLAASYDAIKVVRPDARVFGGALSPRGGDDPTATKQTHSPTTFIQDLGAAYRASGRTTPIMDVFDMHVYMDYSSMPPSVEHPVARTISVADYGKLPTLLGQAFDGTAQPGSTLPIVYGEFGVESIIPAAKAGLYTGTEPVSTHPVDEQTQAAYYAQALKLAYCQPNVIGVMIFHVSDESALAGWQSGPNYADDTAKSSLASFRDAADAARSGTLTTCPDQTAPTVALTQAPADGSTVHGSLALAADAADDVGVSKVEFLVDGNVAVTKLVPPYTVSWDSTHVDSGTHTLSVRAWDAAHNTTDSGSVTVTIDNTPPDTTITSAPPTQSPSYSASFSFTASESGATFTCSLDAGAWTACSSPAAYDNLSVGQHTFSVRAADSFGNTDATPATSTWTVLDTTPPDTTITSAPTGTTTSHSASFSFTATETATFECSVDGSSWAACSSPQSYSSLADGSHTFQVRATDAAANVDPTPASATWTIVSTPANDMFAAAQALSGWSGTVTGTTLNATKEPGEPNHAGDAGGHSIWYRWKPTSTGWITISTAGSRFDTLLAVYTGSSVSSLSLVAQNDDASSTYTSRVQFKARAWTTYWIAVDGWGGASGFATLARS
jgi:Bacterial Ig domain